jgi:hypothetical protein
VRTDVTALDDYFEDYYQEQSDLKASAFYENEVKPVANKVAADMEQKLREMGFDVTVEFGDE